MGYIETRANEKSTYIVSVGLNFTPDAMTWRLTDEDGTVINSRSAVSVTVPSTANEITLTSADLAVTNAARVRRVFTVKGTYNGGANSFADEMRFDIKELKGVS